jgi:hypothetical protein
MRKIAAVALAAVLAGTGFVLQTASPAVAKTVRVKSVKADIDGVGHKDSVKVYRIKTASDHRVTYRVTVTNAKGKKASRTIVTQGRGSDARKITKPVAAIAHLDGAAGAEIVLTKTDYRDGISPSRSFIILTWRKGKLVTESPAKGTWGAGSDDGEGASYRTWLVFDRVGGVHYALTCHDDYIDQVGAQRSMDVAAWVNGKWQAQPTAPVTTTTDPRCDPARSATLVLR